MVGPGRHEESHRALLVGVAHYASRKPLQVDEDLGDIAAVEPGLAELRKALSEGGVFDEDGIEVLSSPGVEQFENCLGHARDRTDGLLLVYFAGHGIADTRAGGDGRLLLGLRDAKVEDGPGFPGWIRWEDVLNRLRSGKSRPRHTVVILDCCYAGNASGAWEALDVEDQKRVSLLLAVQKNQRIDAGDATTPTPYTAQLVRQLGQSGDEFGGEAGGPVTLGMLQKRLSESLKSFRTVGGREWSPQACRQDAAEDEILSRPARGGGERNDPPPDGPVPGPVRRPGLARIVTAALLAAMVALTAGLWWALSGDSHGAGPGASCANHPPLELRVLTDPDLGSAVRKAADSFMASDANKDGDRCHRTGITVYSAGAAETVDAFRTQYGEWAHAGRSGFNPVGTVGPQPDVWIPASSASAHRAQDEGSNQSSVLTLDFDDRHPLAYAPMVVLVPEQLAEADGRRAGRRLAELMTAMKEKDKQTEVRRADPRYTDAGLAAARGLYGTDTPRTVELGQRRQGRPAPTGEGLVCALARGTDAGARAADRRTAVLAAEPTLGQYRHCAGETGVTRVAEYPSDVPGLDPVFVHVRWNDARRDEEERDRAVQRFRDWLVSDQGRAAFRDEAFRDGPQAPFPSAAPGLRANPGPMPRPLSADEAADTLEKYRQANDASRVRFLLDSSGSMSRWWDGPNGAREILRQSLSRFGPEDVYGVWGVASTGSGTPYHELLAFGTHGSWAGNADKNEQDKAAEAGRKVDDAEPELSSTADTGGALREALNGMPRGDEDDGHPQMVVVLTDDQGNDRMSAGQLDDLVSFVAGRKVPVVMVSFGSAGCLKDRLDLRVAEASGGRCLDARDDLARDLGAEISHVAQGH
ncbi:VWA domain-containing protein [Streptomyces sp. ET3-23]|uniref:vWA domain-containing protein n=1 Tax=Streptomyces sp. ET3-23 TaxID=2885643 RepID=UPI001D1157D2|nr:substrate-binding domain-containing protein [Streptomyces sp. ET3-23]MCC2275905.1 VWA domain-containing protein [Streptomyces sp. ET3-23]